MTTRAIFVLIIQCFEARWPYPLCRHLAAFFTLHAAKDGELIIEIPKNITLFSLRRDQLVRYLNTIKPKECVRHSEFHG